MGAGVYFAKEHCSYNYCLASILRAYGELCFIDILHKPSSFFCTVMPKNDTLMVKNCTNINFD
jgi:hypothetical protein